MFARCRPVLRAACLLLAALLACLAWLAPVRAGEALADAHLLERNVKAAFLYKFMGYVEWPPVAEANTVTIGVAGSPAMAAALAAATAGRTVGNKPLLVRQVGEGDSLAGLQALFISAGLDEQAQSALLRRAQPRGVLTVTESRDAVRGVIHFKTVDGRVRFDVSLDAAERAGLRLSSRLLAVAHQVYKGAP